MEVVLRRGLREDQWRDALPLTRGRQGGRGPREQSYVTKTRDKGRGTAVHKNPEAPRFSRGHDYRRAALVLGGNEPTGQCPEAGDRPLGQQPGQEQSFALPTTRAGDAPVPTDEGLKV